MHLQFHLIANTTHLSLQKHYIQFALKYTILKYIISVKVYLKKNTCIMAFNILNFIPQ